MIWFIETGCQWNKWKWSKTSTTTRKKKKKKRKEKEKEKNGFLGLFIGISCLFIRNTLADKAKISGRGVIRAGEGTIRVG